MTRLGLTPAQTVGPFFAIGLPWPDGPHAVQHGTPGAVWVRGRVLDGAGEPVPDALIETWQADPSGHYVDPGATGDLEPDAPRGFRGFARCPTDADGRYAVLTLKPGPVPGPGVQAPHLNVSVFARGLLDRVVTRVYFPDEVEANAVDPVLGAVADATARATLIATAAGDGYTFDIRLQGENETVFLSI